MERQGGRSRKLVLVPCHLQGHINPMFQLGTILHSRGFSITIAHTQLSFPDASKHPDFAFLQLLSDDSSAAGKDSGDLVDFISDMNLNHKASLQEILTQMVEKLDQHEELPCIIYDALMYSAESVAHRLKLPSIILLLHTGSSSYLITFDACRQLLEEACLPLQASKSEEVVPGLYPLRFKDLPVFDFKNPDTFLELLATLQNTGTSSAIILNSIDCLEQTSLARLQQQFQVTNFPIGPFQNMAPASSCSLLEEDHSCITWLDKQAENSVIYVSFGSWSTVDEKEVAEIAWGLANSKQSFLWVLRPGLVRGSECSDLLSEDIKKVVGERGYIVKWAPQKLVLAHRAVGGFWSHCGWNSTLESISEGVPMICRPFFGDQKINTRYISHVWRVGIELENVLEGGEIERAIQRLMVEKEGKEMRQRALHLKSKIELCIHKGGSTYNFLNELVELIISF